MSGKKGEACEKYEYPGFFDVGAVEAAIGRFEVSGAAKCGRYPRLDKSNDRAMQIGSCDSKSRFIKRHRDGLRLQHHRERTTVSAISETPEKRDVVCQHNVSSRFYRLRYRSDRLHRFAIAPADPKVLLVYDTHTSI